MSRWRVYCVDQGLEVRLLALIYQRSSVSDSLMYKHQPLEHAHVFSKKSIAT